METTALKKIANKRRLDVLEITYKSGNGHIGGCMSCMEIVVCLYYHLMDLRKIQTNASDRDRFILSKGHCAQTLYVCLADTGFFSMTDLYNTFDTLGTIFAEHPTRHINGVELATGSLGHGMSLGVGMAISLKRDMNPAHIYVLAGDGELAEGSTWEAAMAAAKYGLDNITLIIDRNSLQISGYTEDVMPLNDLAAKYRAFGFAVTECDGHDPTAIIETLSLRTPGRPTCVIANTIKGKGSLVMENIAEWHHKIPNEKEYLQIKEDIMAAIEEV